jgi:hypothetical protein
VCYASPEFRRASRIELTKQAFAGRPSAEMVARSAERFEIVGVVRDLGLDPDDGGNEQPAMFHAIPAGKRGHRRW